MSEYYHSVTLDKDKCCGCTNCIKRCPTEAIRVRDGKARIISERCIDCGECIRVCPHHAKRAQSAELSELQSWEYTIALPAPALFGQFNNLDDIDIVLSGLHKIGFDSVYEVSRGAELVSEATRHLMQSGKLKKPVISSACPAIVRLIKLRFPDLIDNVLPLNAPMEVAAMCAKKQAAKETGLPLGKIGVFFITPCPAKVTDVKNSIGRDKSWVDGAIAVSRVYPVLTEAMDKLKPEEITVGANCGIIGVSWATSGGEAAATLNDKYLAADGIENVTRVLDELEDERIGDLEFVELNACSGGCVGGVLNVENAYVAQARIQKLRRYLPVSQNHLTPQGEDGVPEDMRWTNKLEFKRRFGAGHADDDADGRNPLPSAEPRLRKLRRALVPRHGGGCCQGACQGNGLHLCFKGKGQKRCGHPFPDGRLYASYELRLKFFDSFLHGRFSK